MDRITRADPDSLRAFSQQCMAMYDEDLKFIQVDAAFESMLGYSPGELNGSPIQVMIHPDDWGRVRDRIQRRFRGEEHVSHYIFLGRRKDGGTVNISTISTIITLGDQRVSVAACEDISNRLNEVRDRESTEQRLKESCATAIQALSHMSNLRDPYTGRHETRVGKLAAAIGEEMKLSTAVCEALKVCGSVHDIGKISVPTDILSKPGRLTAPEFEIVKSHADNGYNILRRIELAEPIAMVAYQHHERLDGSGYPLGTKGNDIILESRIMAVADVVEAMSSHRPYRAGLGIEAALKEVTTKAEQYFDVEAVAACVRLFRERNFELPS